MREALFTPEEVARLDRLALRARRPPRGGPVGERRSRRVGTGGEFADHRTYCPGDDLRYLDWNVYGRTGDLVVKRFEAEESVRLLLLVDRSASMEGRKAHAARRLAGALAHVALRRHDAVSLAWLPPRDDLAFDVARDRASAEPLFARLLDTPHGGATAHARDLPRLLRTTRRRGPAVLVSDFFDPAGAVGGLRALHARGYDTTAVQVLDPADVDLPVGEALRCVDRETGETVDLDVTPALVASLHAAWRRRSERLEAWCRAREIGWQRFEVSRDLWDVLREMAGGRAGILG